MNISESLIEQLSKTLTVEEKQNIIAFLQKENISTLTIFELSYLAKDPRVAFRAAWILEELVLLNIAEIVPFFTEFLILFPKIKNRSVRRHYSKILSKLLEFNFKNKNNIPAHFTTIHNTINAHDFNNIVEFLFDSVIDSKERVGVKVWCLEALLYLSVRYNWVLEELDPQIDFLAKTNSPAILARSRKIKTLLNTIN